MIGFKIGDKVLINPSVAKKFNIEYGRVGIIEDIKITAKYPYLVTWSDTIKEVFKEHEIILESEFNAREPVKNQEAIYEKFTPKNKQDDGWKPTNPKDAIGVKKVPLSVVPSNVLMEIGVALLEGGAKYGKHNYRVAGIRYSVYYDALMRHIMAWWEGEDLDPDSGLSHVTKAISTLVVLRDAMLNEMFTDDRPPSCPKFIEGLNKKSAEIIEKHQDKNPKHYTINDRELE